MTDATTLGGILRHVRRAAGHTLEDTRVALGGRWTLTAVSRAERDADDEPPAGYVEAFCAAYGVEVVSAGFSFATVTPMTVQVGRVPEPDPTPRQMLDVLAARFPDGPAALSFGDDEGDE